MFNPKIYYLIKIVKSLSLSLFQPINLTYCTHWSAPYLLTVWHLSEQVPLCRGILQKEQVDFCLFISYVFYIPIEDFGHTSFFMDTTVGSGDFCEAIRKSSGCVLSGGMRCYSSVPILFILIVIISSSCTCISAQLPLLSIRKFLYFT
jgi:hypothetical protein